MTILLYCLCAIALVVTGAVVSGGLALPRRTGCADAPNTAQEDALERDLAALLAYGAKEDTDEI